MSGHHWQFKLYNNCPILVQNILISLYGCNLYRQRYGKVYRQYIRELRHKDFSNFEIEKENQNKEFIKLLNYAVNNSPFYNEFYRNIDISKIKSVKDIKLLPILDKETLRKNINRVYTINPKKGIMGFTGGTTGKSLSVVFTKNDFQKRMAYLDYFKEKHGFINGQTKSARFNGKNIIPLGQQKKIFWRDNFILKQRIYSTFYLSRENIPYYIENLNQFQPDEIDGFVTSIYDIARYMKEHNIKATFKPKAVFPTSETVLPFHRQLIEDVFGCPVRDQYASSEGAPFITECEKGHMHENIDTGIFEHIVTDYGIELVLTSFTSYGTPLIRYKIEDNVLKSDIKCKCGSCHPCIQAIDGRKADFLVSEERGNINLGNLSNVIKELPNCIKNIQFVQHDLKNIDILLVADTGYTPEHEQLILDEMTYRFGQDVTFNIIKVNNISREASGKYRLIKNLMK